MPRGLLKKEDEECDLCGEPESQCHCNTGWAEADEVTQLEPGPEPEPEPEPFGSTFVGQTVEVYSHSQNKWVPATITAEDWVMSDDISQSPQWNIQVEYDNGSWKNLGLFEEEEPAVGVRNITTKKPYSITEYPNYEKEMKKELQLCLQRAGLDVGGDLEEMRTRLRDHREQEQMRQEQQRQRLEADSRWMEHERRIESALRPNDPDERPAMSSWRGGGSRRIGRGSWSHKKSKKRKSKKRKSRKRKSRKRRSRRR